MTLLRQGVDFSSISVDCAFARNFDRGCSLANRVRIRDEDRDPRAATARGLI